MDQSKKTLLEYIDSTKGEMVEFLSRYLQIASIKELEDSPGHEAEAASWLKERFESFGLDKVDVWTMNDDSNYPNIAGVVTGSGGGKSLVLHSHMDVVPVPDMERPHWTVDPFGGVVKDGMVWGRGATDVKGGATAMFWVAKALAATGIKLKGDLIIDAICGGEGGPATEVPRDGLAGTVSCIERGYGGDFAIACEPTDNEICTETSSIFYFELTIPGKGAHTSSRNQVLFPQRYGLPAGSEIGVDAVAKAIPFIQMFQRMEVEWNFRWRSQMLGGSGYPVAGDLKGVGPFTINPSFIQGGTYFGTVPPFVKLTYCTWFPNWVDADEVCNEIRRNVEALSSTDDWLRSNPPTLKIPTVRLWKGHRVDPDHEGVRMLGRAYEEAAGRQAMFTGFRAVSAATAFGRHGIPAVTLGAGDIRLAHAADERVPIDQVVDMAKTMAAFAVDWCK